MQKFKKKINNLIQDIKCAQNLALNNPNRTLLQKLRVNRKQYYETETAHSHSTKFTK